MTERLLEKGVTTPNFALRRDELRSTAPSRVISGLLSNLLPDPTLPHIQGRLRTKIRLLRSNMREGLESLLLHVGIDLAGRGRVPSPGDPASTKLRSTPRSFHENS